MQNNYTAPSVEDLKSPKRQLFAVRSLALEQNFLYGKDKGRVGDEDTSPSRYGELLSTGSQIRGSAHLQLAQQTLMGLVDPDTQRGQRGAWLLRPFHESLLWYDARKASPSRHDWSVRKVYMRGSGITLARMLADAGNVMVRPHGLRAVDAIQQALKTPSPLAKISEQLEAALPRQHFAMVESDEKNAWEQARDSRLRDLETQVCLHADGVMGQGSASGPEKLWQLRTALALALAIHVLKTAWSITQTPAADRFLLLSFGDDARAQDPVRQQSEDSFRRARIRLAEATVSTLGRRMRELGLQGHKEWEGDFEMRKGSVADALQDVSHQLRRMTHPSVEENYLTLARTAVENANYGRSEDGFRVLFESIGLIAGTRYRYLTATPDLLGALVGALSTRMPMSSREFFAAVRDEWGFVINQEAAAHTSLAGQLDGAALERNARRAERMMSEAGLALGLSDRTTVVGERAAWSGREVRV
ncbi:hypothetical protein [Actinomycetospora chiangmaiensis]|uniref:hypothetical protein n=1 Tax=Actinomycetospora chiangmaiensis TaxID=402650 RepID=UPI001B7F8127|nr:hypothetical protein [Actinomycetospora chiangmaiensis]